jgi:hypothetical protein
MVQPVPHRATLIRNPRDVPPLAPPRGGGGQVSVGVPFTVGRYSDNELVLFDERASASWIVYPPRSAYDFLGRRRPATDVTLVEHHPWTPLFAPVDHHLHPRASCLLHGAACPANAAIQAAVDLGYDPFA